MEEYVSNRQRDGFDRLAAALFRALPAEEIMLSLQRVGVTPDKLRPHRLFLRSLFSTLLDTYLGGDDLSYGPAERAGHFNWCLQTTLTQLGETGYRYQENADLLEYLREYLRLELYKADEIPSLNGLDTLLNVDQIASQSDLTAFVELWEIIEKTPVKGRRLRTGKVRH